MKLGTSYFGNRMMRHAEGDLRDIRAHGCNWVLHTYDEVDLRFNRGNLRALTQASHKLGMEVYYSPWAIGGVFGGECISAFTGRHPDACQMLSTGERVPHACPSNPEFRDFIKSWIQAAIDAGGDVLFWDEPHLWIATWEGREERENEFACRCHVCQERFRQVYGHAYPKKRTKQVVEFRDLTLYDFLKWATETAKGIKKGIRNAVCLLPHVRTWPNPLWEKIAALKSVDIMATDPYWKRFPYSNPAKDRMDGFVDLMASRLVELGRRHRKEVQAWLQIFALHRQDEVDIDTAVNYFVKAGVKNIGAWGYVGCAAYASIASERPRECWERLGRIYRRVSSKSNRK